MCEHVKQSNTLEQFNSKKITSPEESFPKHTFLVT